MKILIVEDDSLAAAAYTRTFGEEGFDVEVVVYGKTGIARVKSWKPNGVVLDFTNQEQNGIEALKVLRADARFEHLPVVVLMANLDPVLVNRAVGAGATRVYDKARISPADLASAFRQVFHLKPVQKRRRERKGLARKPPAR